MTDMKVSIITVCYNAEKTLEKTIKSVIGQSYKNIEYIIIDGGSTDASVDIIKKYNKYISYWISEPDQGVYDAMNKGLLQTTGDIVGIINSDDWYANSTIESVVKCFSCQNVDIIHGKLICVSIDGDMLYEDAPREDDNGLYYNMIYHHPTCFIRRDMYRIHGGFDCRYKIAADYDLLLRLRVNGATFRYLDSDCAYFRLGGLSGQRIWLCNLEAYKISKKHILHMKKDSSIIEEHIVRLEENYFKRRIGIAAQWLKKRDFRYSGMENILKNMLFKYGKNKYAIFGAGIRGEKVSHSLKNASVCIDLFIDNNEKRQGKILNSIKVKSIDSLDKSMFIIIANKNFSGDIGKQLTKLGLVQGMDYLDSDEFIYHIVTTYLRSIYKVGKFDWVRYNDIYKELF